MSSDLLKSAIRTAVPREFRNWLRSPMTSAAWLWDAASFRLGKRKTLLLAPGRKLICHPRAYKVVLREMAWEPEQKIEMQSFLSECSDKMHLFDLGAHFGIFSLVAASYGAKSIAVDPSPIAVRMIQIQTRLNGATDRIQIERAAVGEAAGTIEMLSSGVFTDGFFRVVRGKPRNDAKKVNVTTVDELTKRYGLPTLIKIDVEGHEAPVLRGARDTLSRCSPILFIELHNDMLMREGQDPASALNEMSTLGYEKLLFNGKMIERAEILGKRIARIVATR